MNEIPITPTSVLRRPASRAWFTAFNIARWGLPISIGILFLEFIFTIPYSRPGNTHWLLVLVVYSLIVAFVWLIGRVLRQGLEEDSAIAKATISFGLLVVVFVGGELILFAIAMFNRHVLG